jgi:hypothetical protein
MYPEITLGSWTIDMTGLGVVWALITSMIVAYFMTRTKRLQFIKLFYRIPIALIVMYLLGGYASFAISSGSLLPTSMNDIFQILTPYEYSFHIIGLVIGWAMMVYQFLKTIPAEHEQKMRMNIIAVSVCAGLIPLGIWLLLGDDVIGTPTLSMRGVETFRPDISQWSTLGSVYPVGILFTLTWLLGLVIHFVRRSTHPAQGYLTLGLVALCVAVIDTLIFQPQYGVMQLGDIRLNMTTYVSVGIALLLIHRYLVLHTPS